MFNELKAPLLDSESHISVILTHTYILVQDRTYGLGDFLWNSVTIDYIFSMNGWHAAGLFVNDLPDYRANFPYHAE